MVSNRRTYACCALTYRRILTRSSLNNKKYCTIDLGPGFSWLIAIKIAMCQQCTWLHLVCAHGYTNGRKCYLNNMAQDVKIKTALDLNEQKHAALHQVFDRTHGCLWAVRIRVLWVFSEMWQCKQVFCVFSIAMCLPWCLWSLLKNTTSNRRWLCSFVRQLKGENSPCPINTDILFFFKKDSACMWIVYSMYIKVHVFCLKGP